MVRNIVIIPCAGSGSRFNSAIPKQYLPLLDKTVLDWTLQAFLRVKQISAIYVVCQADDGYIEDYRLTYSTVSFLTYGGETRAATVTNALDIINANNDDWILVHDAARCCVDPSDIEKMIVSLEGAAIGGILASKATDTLKQVDIDGNIIATIDRSSTYQAQTPQMFRYEVLKSALVKCRNANMNVTDEASAVEFLGKTVKIVESDNCNLKVTYPQDLLMAECIIKNRNKEE
jgi:2-C-methyl-D-erythritol 4-phosphate cytidylyltransferase